MGIVLYLTCHIVLGINVISGLLLPSLLLLICLATRSVLSKKAIIQGFVRALTFCICVRSVEHNAV